MLHVGGATGMEHKAPEEWRMTIKEQLDAIKQQAQVIAEIHDLLHVGIFQGSNSQKVLMGQAYLKGLHEQVSKEVKRLEEALAEEMKPTFTEALKEQIKA
jgi:hypothetical protein